MEENFGKMEKSAERFWNRKTASLIPYVPGEQPRGEKLIKLNTNENPYPPAPEVIEAIRKFDYNRLRLYPDPAVTDFRQAVAEYFGIEKSMVFAGNGSDEVLAFAFQAFFEPDGRQVNFPDISYSFYPVYARFYELNWKAIPVDSDYRIVVDDYCQAGHDVVIANPNAPTGIALTLEEIERIVSADCDRLVIIDEAYVDFGADSAAALLSKYDNLLVIQTLSKSRSLAGMRVGFAIGSAALISGLERVRDSINSYTVDMLAQVAATAAVRSGRYFEETRQKIMMVREETAERLTGLGLNVLPSSANFIFAAHPQIAGSELALMLRQKGVLVRHFQHKRIDQYLRISIGTQEEMNILIDRLAEILDYNRV
jgi:histidinol-phosphate aminotransferase